MLRAVPFRPLGQKTGSLVFSRSIIFLKKVLYFIVFFLSFVLLSSKASRIVCYSVSTCRKIKRKINCYTFHKTESWLANCIKFFLRNIFGWNLKHYCISSEKKHYLWVRNRILIKGSRAQFYLSELACPIYNNYTHI